jgi:hypothetical protein
VTFSQHNWEDLRTKNRTHVEDENKKERVGARRWYVERHRQ